MTFRSELLFVRILFPFIAGISVSYLFLNEDWIRPCFLFTIICFTILVLINIFYQRLKAYNFKLQVGIILVSFWFILGLFWTLLYKTNFQSNYFGKKSYSQLKGWISNEPQLKNDILRFEVTLTAGYIDFKPQNVIGTVLIALKVNKKIPILYNYGDELMIVGNYSPVEPTCNPAEFDFRAWLASKNIYHQTFINQNQLIKLKHGSGNPIIKYALSVRKRQVEIYRKLIRNDEAFAVASTLVLGYRADLSKDTLAAYSKTGTIHALSVSGMHVGIIYIFLNWALFFLDKNKFTKALKLLLICALIWYYSLLTGFSPSVLRSAVMLTVYILAKAFNKSSNSYNILAFTALCLLVFNPFLIWDVGFQLSFLAVFGLIYLQPKIYNWFDFEEKWLDKLWSTIALSLAAQIATFPLSIYYFHQFPLYFIFSNLFILLPLTAMMYLGIGILILKLYFLAPIFEWIINFTNNGLKWISDLPFSGITSIWISPWQLLLLSLSLALTTISLAKYQKKLFINGLFLALVFQLFAGYRAISILHQRKVIFFSLRKNYAAAFIDGRTAIVVTDLNPTTNNYLFFVQPALNQLQLTKIHFVSWEKDTTLFAFSKKEHQLVFHNYRVLLLDQYFNDQKIAQLPKFNAVWFHQNPKKNMIELHSEVLFSTLLIDASNKDYLQKKYQQEANKINIVAHILKKNKAYLIDLK